MNIDKQLYKIIRGHFRLCVDGLFLLFKEPTSELIADSYEVYEEAYDAAYMESSCVDSEINSILVDNDLWNPFFEKDLKKLQDDVENLKVEAFENFFNSKALLLKKMQIHSKESQIEEMLQKKHRVDHLSCHSVAETSRWYWLMSKCIFHNDGTPIDISKFDAHKLLESYRENIIPHKQIRKISRLDNWRQIWSASKKTGSLFNKPAIDLSTEQLILMSYSSMYDGVYEHPESPSEEVIDDDVCLDGWMILQKRKNEKNKKAAEVDQVIKNPKIKNANEVFIVSNKEDADKIFAMNDGPSRATINQRAQFVKEKGRVSENDMPDVRQKIQMAQVNAARDSIKGRK